MYQLSERQYPILSPLVKDIIHNKALIYAILEGTSQGKVLVDHITKPTVAFIENEFTYIVGDENNITFNKELCQYIFGELLPMTDNKELVLFLPYAMDSDLNQRLREYGCMTIHRKTFSFKCEDFFKKLPEGLSLGDDFYIKESSSKRPLYIEFAVYKGSQCLSKCCSVAMGQLLLQHLFNIASNITSLRSGLVGLLERNPFN